MGGVLDRLRTGQTLAGPLGLLSHQPPATVFADDDLSSDEITCFGIGCDDDDDGNGDGDGRDQTRHILTQAEQYLRGTNSIYLHSASPRGPVLESPWRRTGTGI